MFVKLSKRILSTALIMGTMFTYSLNTSVDAYSNQPASWAADAVTELKCSGLINEGIMNNYNKNITRKEFVLPLVLTEMKFKKEGSIEKVAGNKDKVFTDIGYDSGIMAAYRQKIVSGYPDGTFRPNGEITREEACVMMVKMLTIIKPEKKINMGDYVYFNDATSISSWARPYVVYCYKNNIMSGTSTLTMSPKNKITREQYYTMLYRLAAENGIISKRSVSIDNLDYYPICDFKVPKSSKITFSYPELSTGVQLKLHGTVLDATEISEIRSILGPQLDSKIVDSLIDALRDLRGKDGSRKAFATYVYETYASWNMDKGTNNWHWEISIVLNQNK